MSISIDNQANSSIDLSSLDKSIKKVKNIAQAKIDNKFTSFFRSLFNPKRHAALGSIANGNFSSRNAIHLNKYPSLAKALNKYDEQIGQLKNSLKKTTINLDNLQTEHLNTILETANNDVELLVLSRSPKQICLYIEQHKDNPEAIKTLLKEIKSKIKIEIGNDTNINLTDILNTDAINVITSNDACFNKCSDALLEVLNNNLQLLASTNSQNLICKYIEEYKNNPDDIADLLEQVQKTNNNLLDHILKENQTIKAIITTLAENSNAIKLITDTAINASIDNKIIPDREF